MVSLDLTREEQEILIKYIESDVNDLHSEIAHTSSHDFKEDLKIRREVLRKVLEQLQA